MRRISCVIFLLLALWRGVIDWQATIGQGQAFRPASLERLWAAWSPASHGALIEELRASALWDPALATLLATPLLLVLLLLSAFFWLIRRRKPRQRRLF